MSLEVLIQQIANKGQESKTRFCDAIVVSVDEESRTCIVNSVSPNDNFDNLKIRLTPDISDGDVCLPEIDTNIIVAFTDYTSPYMVSAGWLNKKTVTVGNQGYEIVDGKITFNDGSFHGLAKVEQLTEQFNKIEQDINDLKTALNQALSTPVTEPGNGAPSAFQIQFLAQLSSYFSQQLTETQQSDIENPNIVHGEKLE